MSACTGVATAGAAQRMGDPRSELHYDHRMPECIPGMGIVVGLV